MVRVQYGSGSTECSSCHAARLTVGTRRARVRESPLAKRVTSWPRSTRTSASDAITRSVPPYAGGGTGSIGGASRPIRIRSTGPLRELGLGLGLGPGALEMVGGLIEDAHLALDLAGHLVEQPRREGDREAVERPRDERAERAACA